MKNLTINKVIGTSINGWSRITAGAPSFTQMIGSLKEGIAPMEYTEMINKETNEKARVYIFDNATLYSIWDSTTGKSCMYIKTEELENILNDIPELPFNLSEMDRTILPSRVKTQPVV
jgi:hypothetical protein